MATTPVVPVGGALVGGTAPVGFTSAAPTTRVDLDLVVEWDFDGDGDFDETVEDITGYVMSAESMSGRDFPSSLTGKAGPGQLRLTLLNSDDRFSYFNQASPLTTAPNSLRTGRKIRVRTTDAVAADPVLLARDRFTRPDGALGVAETGQTWTPQFGSFTIRGGVASSDPDTFTAIVETVDVGATGHYAQATIRQLHPHGSRFVGLVVGWFDSSNYTIVVYDSGTSTTGISIYDIDGGVQTLKEHYPLYGWEGMTIGAGRVGNAITAYVGGVPVASTTLTGPVNGTHVGLYANHEPFSGRSPEVGDFHVWDKVAAPADGVLWTGDVLDVSATVPVGGPKVVTVTAEGTLARSARAQVASPRLARAGAATGLIVGDVLARAGLLHPPAPLDEGTVITGPVGIDDSDALSLARVVEETERGFLHETNEGQIGYQSAGSRTGASSQAWFSDTPGVGQHPYSGIAPADHKGQIVNRVTAGVAAEAPSGITVTQPVGTQHVDITLPAVNKGDLLVVFIAASHLPTVDLWQTPIWWYPRRTDLKATRGMRVYDHICDGTEGGTVVRFFNNPTAVAGLWQANVYRIENWYDSPEGIAMGEIARGSDAAPLVHGWGRAPTLFIVVNSGIAGTGAGMAFNSSYNAPDGYALETGLMTSSGVLTYEAGMMSGYKVDVSESEDPTPWEGLVNVSLLESVVYAVRGYNGPHTKATLEDPRTTGGDGRFVTIEDIGSQDEHNVIRSNPAVPVLFATEADARAYGDAVLSEFADDRPIVSLSFWAQSSAALRDQAITRRVGDKITVTASGATGLGVQRDWFIENVAHRWPNPKVWECTWQLSPA